MLVALAALEFWSVVSRETNATPHEEIREAPPLSPTLLPSSKRLTKSYAAPTGGPLISAIARTAPVPRGRDRRSPSQRRTFERQDAHVRYALPQHHWPFGLVAFGSWRSTCSSILLKEHMERMERSRHTVNDVRMRKHVSQLKMPYHFYQCPRRSLKFLRP
jgi:hypothetical protein